MTNKTKKHPHTAIQRCLECILKEKKVITKQNSMIGIFKTKMRSIYVFIYTEMKSERQQNINHDDNE